MRRLPVGSTARGAPSPSANHHGGAWPVGPTKRTQLWAARSAGVARRRPSREVSRGRDRGPARPQDQARAQTRRRARADAQRDVDAVGGQPGDAIGQGQVDPQLGIAAEQRRQAADHGRPEDERGRQVDLAAGHAAGSDQGRAPGLDRAHRLPAPREEGLALGSQRHHPRGPAEQLGPEPVLEGGHRLRHRRGRLAQRLGGAAERQRAGDLDEGHDPGEQLGRRWHRAIVNPRLTMRQARGG
jgi:hypothetical protein